MTRISLIALPIGAMLRIEGRGSWATFELTPEQTRVLRDAADVALRPRAPCETLRALLASVGGVA